MFDNDGDGVVLFSVAIDRDNKFCHVVRCGNGIVPVVHGGKLMIMLTKEVVMIMVFF